jgi:tricorn protease
MKKYAAVLCIAAWLAVPESTLSQQETRLLRFPAIHENQVVFTYAGNLYTVAATGGTARRITSHDGYEMFARFSPDGDSVAFTGQYDGNTEVFVVPSAGGIPKRLTYSATLDRDDVSDRMGPNNIVMEWKPDGRGIVFRSRMRSYNAFIGSLFTVPVSGDLPEQLPVPRGGFCSFSPDGRKMAFNRVFREFRTWKKYRGGMADDIWIFDFTTQKTENLTRHAAQDIIPMWIGNGVYFLSDRDENKRMNLYRIDLETRKVDQLTTYRDFDIKFPSNDEKSIVYEYAGDIYRFDVSAGRSEKIPITISDDLLTGREEIRQVDKNIVQYEIAPDGKRALFGAHGEIFTVPAKHGPTRNLTNTSGVHERGSKWSPDGKWIAFISDRSGEDEIWILAQDAAGDPVRITEGGDVYKYSLEWSPDSRKLLWNDRKMRLRYVEIESKAVTEVAQATAWEITDFAWSPDSKWISFVMPEEQSLTKLLLYSLDTRKSIEVTDGWFDAGSPAFSSDGKLLFFVSSRDFKPVFSWTEFNHAYQDMARIYFVILDSKTESPFRPESDEVGLSGKSPASPKKLESQKSDKDKEKNEKQDSLTVSVDPRGLSDRIVGLPIKPSRYNHPVSVENVLYYTRSGSADEKPVLLKYDLKEQKETELGQIDGFEISANRKMILVLQDQSYALLELPKDKIEIKDKLDLSALEMRLNRHEEWRQIFNECWRQMRDFFYSPTLHGADWPAIRDKYGPLVDHVNHRNDLTYLIGEMIGELNVGHSYVGDGDRPAPKRMTTGLLGAVLERDPGSRCVRIKKILAGQNWDKSSRSPLTEIGVNAAAGDYILAVDGKPTELMANPYEALVNKADKQVRLRLNTVPSEKNSREVTVVPIADESRLYYFDWVQTNLKKVTKATQGKVGYVHVPDMGEYGLNEFAKYYYPQIRKNGLIVDVRGNSGGSVSPMLIERLRREAAMIGIARNTTPYTDPDGLILGPLVCLADEFSASDGDIFPYRFRKYNLGKIVGKRTWGGVVGIRGSLPLVDGGFLMKPEFAIYDTKGKEWIIEGVGVEPDIFVDNDPAREFAGTDEQLDKAIEVILDELKTEEKTIPKPPAYPEKM